MTEVFTAKPGGTVNDSSMAVNTETKQMNSLVAEHEIKEIADLDI